MFGTTQELGDLIFGMAVVFSVLIVILEFRERRREHMRERTLLDQIEREYEAFHRAGWL